MPDLPEVREKFVADTSGYTRPLREAARQADDFSRNNEQAAAAALRFGAAAREGGDAAARAEKNAAQAADRAADNYRQLARDAELAGAAQKLASLKASGAVQQHNSALKDLRKRFPELEHDASGAFKMMTSAGSSFGQGLDSLTSGMTELTGIGRIMPGVIIAGLELLPAVASAAAGAITLGLGGAFTAVGIIAASKNAQIRQEYSSLGKEVFGHLQADAQPFVGVLEHIGQYAEDEFRSWSPLIKQEFADTAPVVDDFAHKAISSLDEFKPAVKSIMTGFRAQLKGLGPELAPSMHNIAVGVQAIGDAAAKNPQALGELAHDLSLIVRVGGDVIGFLTRWEGELNLAAQTANAFAVGPLGTLALGIYKIKNLMSGGGAKMGQEFIDFGSAASGASGAMTRTGMATEDLLSAQKAATMTTDQLKSALDRLTGANQSAFDTQTAYSEALKAANAQAKTNNAGIDGNSKAVLANRQALSSLAQATKAQIESGGLSAKQIEKQRQAFIRVAEGMGVSKQRAKELADQLLGVSGNIKKIPDKKDTKLGATDNTKPAVASAKRNANSFTSRVWRAQLTAQSKVSGAVHSAISAADGFAHKVYRAQLTAQNRIMGVVSGAISAASGFARRTYRASLTAVNNAWSALNSALAAGRSWAGRVFTATFNVVKHLFSTGGMVGGYAEGGPVQRFPTGGQVHGPGTGTSDSVPIMASNGEYVVNAKQTAKYKPLLDAINFGLDGYAKGGGIGIGKLERKQIARLHAASARLHLARSRPEELAAMAAQQALASMRRSVYGGFFGGGPSTPGSAHGTVVQHVTNVTLHVAGSIRSDQDIAKMIQRIMITNRMPVTLPAGRF